MSYVIGRKQRTTKGHEFGVCYVIVRSDGLYVTKPGSGSAYTKYLQHAWVFASREEAERERCPENECVVPR